MTLTYDRLKDITQQVSHAIDAREEMERDADNKAWADLEAKARDALIRLIVGLGGISPDVQADMGLSFDAVKTARISSGSDFALSDRQGRHVTAYLPVDVRGLNLETVNGTQVEEIQICGILGSLLRVQKMFLCCADKEDTTEGGIPKETIIGPEQPDKFPDFGGWLAYYLLGWNESVRQRRSEIEQEKAAQRQQAEQEAQRRKLLEAERDAFLASMEHLKNLASSVESTIDEAIADAVRPFYTIEKDVTLYHVQWCAGIAGEGETLCEFEDGWALTDTLDEQGYIHLVDRDRRVKLSMECHKPTFTEHRISCFDDLDYALWSSNYVTVHGVAMAYIDLGDYTRTPYKLWNAEQHLLSESVKTPLSWLRKLLGMPEKLEVTISPSETQQELMASIERDDSDRVYF